MKKISIIIGLVFLVSCSSLKVAEDFDPIQDYQVITYSNGLRVLHVPDNRLPYLSLSLSIFSGSASDPKGLEGVTAATISLLTKGTQKYTANRFMEEVEVLGAEVDSFIDEERASISIEGLSWHEDKLLDLFSDMVFHPRFSGDEVARYKSKTLAQIQQALDQPAFLANLAFKKELYKGSSYSRPTKGTLQGIQNINRSQVLGQYKKILSASNSWLVVVGKTSPGFFEKLEEKFVKMEALPKLESDRLVLEKLAGTSITLVDKPDAAQAEIRIGHYGIQRDIPDYMEASVANSILGQGFTSRLMDRVRDQLGLTYSISSAFQIYNQKGYFSIKTFTQNERVGQTLEEILKIYKQFYDSGVTVREFELARKSMVGKFPLLLETPEKLAYNLLVLRFFGVSDDYLKSYRKNMEALNFKKVNQSIQKHFDPNNLKIVILGRKDLVREQIQELAPVEDISYKELLQ